jgi:hypothetical protein
MRSDPSGENTEISLRRTSKVSCGINRDVVWKASSTCMALSFLLCLIVLLRARERSKQQPAPFAVPGGTPLIAFATAGAVAMVGVALLDPWVRGSVAVPLEWVMLVGWGTVALIAWRLRGRGRGV